MNLLEQIEALSLPVGREKEIADLARANRNQVPAPLLREFRELENSRIQALSDKQNEAWVELKKLGYKRVQYQSNPAVESGHSDYDDPADRVSFLGIQTPSGRFIDGGAIWEGALMDAIKDAGI